MKLGQYNYKNRQQQMNYHHYFNQIQLSSVNAVECDKENSCDEDSIINELDHFYSRDEQSPLVHKIQSFVYAEEVKEQKLQSPKRDFPLLDGYLESKLNKYGNFRRQAENFQDKKYYIQSKVNPAVQKGPNIYKKSIKQQIIEENKLLQQKLNLNKRPHRAIEFQCPGYQNNRVIYNQNDRRQLKLKSNGEGTLTQDLLKMEEQYTNSNTIKYYNFIMKELPLCQNCHSGLTHVVDGSKTSQLVCKKCYARKENQNYNPLIGILYDLQTKIRFEQEVQLSQLILDGLNKELQRLKKQMDKIESIKDKIGQIKNNSRKKYKQISQAKYFIKKNLSKLTTQDILELALKIPREYLQQMDRWRQIDQMYEQKWKHIYSAIYRMMPIYLHDHVESKILCGLHKILNYHKNQEVKLSVSQHIKFPIKQMESVVFMVDGTYNLPVFENIKHLQMQFQHKKTQRELNLLFGNLPREIYSLGFAFNHKIHSHISAQNFPFLKYIAPVVSIKKLDLTIENVKQFGDILRLPELLTDKIQFKLKITKHLFSRQELNLPINYYQKLLEKLGPNLIKFQLSIPESIDSSAKLNFEKLVEKQKLCVFVLQRGEKQRSKNKNAKILQVLNEEANSFQKRKQKISKKLLLQRAKLIHLIKSTNFQKLNEKQLFINSIAALL